MELQTTINKILTFNTKDRLRILFAEPSTLPDSFVQPTPNPDLNNLYHELIIKIDNAITQNNIDELKNSNLLEFLFDYGLLDIIKKIIKYYSIEEIEKARPYARANDIFINKLKNVQLKRKGRMETFINSYIETYNNISTSKAAVLSLSLPNKRRNSIPRLYPEIIDNIISFHQPKNNNNEIINTLPKSLRNFVIKKGGTRKRKNNKK